MYKKGDYKIILINITIKFNREGYFYKYMKSIRYPKNKKM